MSTPSRTPEILDPLFREAVSAIDVGDVNALERLLAAHPKLDSDRTDYGEGYFRQPYLLRRRPECLQPTWVSSTRDRPAPRRGLGFPRRGQGARGGRDGV